MYSENHSKRNNLYYAFIFLKKELHAVLPINRKSTLFYVHFFFRLINLTFKWQFGKRFFFNMVKLSKLKKFIALALFGILMYTLFTENLMNQSMGVNKNKKPQIELTLRMTLNREQLDRLFCDFLRSTSLFWNPTYGDIVLILDEEDKEKNFEFEPVLHSLGLPFNFRFVYEADLVRRDYIEVIRKKKGGHWYGKLRMFYSSFIMDEYTKEDGIISWIDTDVVFTLPVTDESIFKNGKLIVKGVNDLHVRWIVPWKASNIFAIGLPMVSNFMSSFPTPVYAKTLRNCRSFIMRRLNAATFQEAFVKIMEFERVISPVNIVFSYAYYFERDLYDWHIDVAPETLSVYNQKYLPSGHYLLESDITPELDITVHTRHYKQRYQALEKAICYSQIALDMTDIPHCDKFRNETNLMLFECQSDLTHVNSWCETGPKREHCRELVKERYKKWVDQYRKTGIKYNTTHLKVIQDVAKTNYGINCYNFTYVPYGL